MPGVRPRPLLGISPVWWLNLLLVGTAAALFFTVVEGSARRSRARTCRWWALASGFFVAERCVVHLQFRRSAHSFSLGDIPLVFGLLFASGDDLWCGALLGTSLHARCSSAGCRRSSWSSTSPSSRSPPRSRLFVVHNLVDGSEQLDPAPVGRRVPRHAGERA